MFIATWYLVYRSNNLPETIVDLSDFVPKPVIAENLVTTNSIKKMSVGYPKTASKQLINTFSNLQLSRKSRPTHFFIHWIRFGWVQLVPEKGHFLELLHNISYLRPHDQAASIWFCWPELMVNWIVSLLNMATEIFLSNNKHKEIRSYQ